MPRGRGTGVDASGLAIVILLLQTMSLLNQSNKPNEAAWVHTFKVSRAPALARGESSEPRGARLEMEGGTPSAWQC